MSPWKSALLHLYYFGTSPYRSWYRTSAAAAGTLPAIVLFYHRIADDRADSCTTSNSAFARQIAWLQRNVELISLAELQRRIGSAGNWRPCASITFDDGYAENCRQAIPLLIREKIPCTYFVTASNVLQGLPFEHDVECGHRLPPNTPEELRAMAAAGVEIGAHSYSHADLGRLSDPERLRVEVVEARDQLQAAVGCPIRYFAFPYGQRANLSRQAFDLAAAAGYDAACSAYGGFNLPGQDGFHLQRIVVDTSTIRLKNWVTGDPRKRNLPRPAWEPPAGWRANHVAT